jgi:endonuclease YncB( thermonuclease family)
MASTATIQPPAAETVRQSPGRSRAIDPDVVAPPSTGNAPLERAEPRPPLSNLSLALPPKPKPPGEWKGKPLFQPVATAAGTIEAKGHTIAISGIEAVKPDESCTDPAGKSWRCGQAARTAFRAFLRGRAITCAQPEGSHGTAVACHIGKQDIGQWLVENGWARPLGSGPYVKAGEAARKAKKGIFGAAPDLSGLPPPPPPVETPALVSPSILDLSGTAATPPAALPEPGR